MLDVVLAVLLWRAIPDLEPKARVRYPALFGSVFTVVRQERVVRWTLVLAGIGFALFTMFWTAITFLLSGDPVDYPVSAIGLVVVAFGVAALAGGSVLAGVLWSAGGWRAVPLCGAGLALVVWAFGRRGPLVVPASSACR